MRNWKKNWFIIGIIVIILAIGLVSATGPLFTEGESPIKMAATIWYLEDSGRSLLRIPMDDYRFLVNAVDKEEIIVDYLSSNGPYNRSDWEYISTNEVAIIMTETKGDITKEVEIPYKYFKEKYVIATLPQVNRN